MSFDDIAQKIEQTSDRAALEAAITHNPTLMRDMTNYDQRATLLMLAAQAGNIIAVELLLARCKNTRNAYIVDEISQYGNTALTVAIHKNHTGIVKQLLDFPCKFEITAPIRKQASEGPVVAVELTDVSGSNFYFVDEVDAIALFEAVKNGNPEIIDLLIQYGADLSIRSTSGNSSAFTIAAGKGDLETLKKLIAHWKNEQVIQPYLEAAMRVAAKNGHIALVDFLGTQLIDIHAKNKEGLSALMMAALHGHANIVEKLLKTASLAEQKIAYVHATKYALKKESYDILRLFSEQATDINSVDQMGESILMSVIDSATPGLLEKIIKKNKEKINLNYSDKNHDCALIKAIKQEKIEAVQILLKYGANSNVNDIRGEHALFTALRTRKPHIIEAVLSALSKDKENNKAVIDSALVFATTQIYASSEEINLLIQHGADINAADEDGNSLLMRTILTNHKNAFMTLINTKRINLDKRNKNGDSAFSLAAASNDLDMIEHYLISFPPKKIQDYYDAFYLSYYAQNNSNSDKNTKRKEQIWVRLLQTFALNSTFNQEKIYALKAEFIPQAIRNNQMHLLVALLDLKELDEKIEIMPLLKISIEQENKPAFLLLLKNLHEHIKENPEEIDFEVLFEQALNLTEFEALDQLLDIMINKDKAITKDQLRAWQSPFREDSPIYILFSEEAIAKRYLKYMHSIPAKDAQNVIEAAKPYKALIVQAIIEQPYVAQLELSIGKTQTHYNHALSQFLHTNTGTWYYPDTSIDEIKDAITKKHEATLDRSHIPSNRDSSL